MRGGSWNNSADNARCACWDYPNNRNNNLGFLANFTRRLERNIDAHRAGRISFGELDASVRGWINHVRYADTWGLREHVFACHPTRTAGA